MRLVCISDTHDEHEVHPVPDGDVLIFAGDMCTTGIMKEVRQWGDWFASQPHKHKLFIAGNHDTILRNNSTLARSLLDPNLVYLQNDGYIIDGLVFWGSPYTPRFGGNYDAFMEERGDPLAHIWSMIPDDVNVLITHGPPRGILDLSYYYPRLGLATEPEHAGDDDLRTRVKQLSDLKLHVFGHVHDSYGVETIDGTTYVNASIMDHEYFPVNPPIVIDL
jgi:Icc-related predicted phosphoesterase